MAEYDAGSITVLEGLDAVRKRPGMYIGGVGKAGLHHLVWEVLDNAVDEAINGHAKRIKVEVGTDLKTVKVVDDGRGIPHGKSPKDPGKRYAMDLIFTVLHAGGKFGDSAYGTSGGRHGGGSSVVNALSSSLTVCSYRDGVAQERTYVRGAPKGRMKTSSVGRRRRGTVVTFVPDPEIFGDQVFDPETIKGRLRDKAYLTGGVEFTFHHPTEGADKFCFLGGLEDYLHDTVRADSEIEWVTEATLSFVCGGIQVALGWTNSSGSKIYSFANGVPTPNGGTHDKGLRDAVVKSIKAVLAKSEDVPKRLKISSEVIRDGLFAFVSVFIPDPQFQGQTKEKLNNVEVAAEVYNASTQPISDWLNQNSSQTRNLVRRIVQIARARQAAKDAYRVEVSRRTPTSRLSLPGKLADCSSRVPEECELVLVEGDSAGGSAKQGRDRKNQAVLPLRGKVLNVENVPESRVAKNEELKSIIDAIGCGYGSQFRREGLRYGKIILLMDADSDGQHITTLLLTFFYRYLRDLIEQGRIYVAVPPLYKITFGKKTFWAVDDSHLRELRRTHGKGRTGEVTRFKGLGEMDPDVLFATTLDPGARTLQRIAIIPGDEVATEELISACMGKDPARRRELLGALPESLFLDV